MRPVFYLYGVGIVASTIIAVLSGWSLFRELGSVRVFDPILALAVIPILGVLSVALLARFRLRLMITLGTVALVSHVPAVVSGSRIDWFALTGIRSDFPIDGTGSFLTSVMLVITAVGIVTLASVSRWLSERRSMLDAGFDGAQVDSIIAKRLILGSAFLAVPTIGALAIVSFAEVMASSVGQATSMLPWPFLTGAFFALLIVAVIYSKVLYQGPKTDSD